MRATAIQYLATWSASTARTYSINVAAEDLDSLGKNVAGPARNYTNTLQMSRRGTQTVDV